MKLNWWTTRTKPEPTHDKSAEGDFSGCHRARADEYGPLITELLAICDRLGNIAADHRRGLVLGTREEWDAVQLIDGAVAHLRGAARCLSDEELTRLQREFRNADD